MVMQKRWCIRKDVDIKDFAIAAKLCKEFTPERQKEMLKLITILKLEKFMAPGIKRRRIRKKHLKKTIQDHKEKLAFDMLDMMEPKWIDINTSKEEDRKKSKEAFEAIERIADGKHDEELKKMEEEK